MTTPNKAICPQVYETLRDTCIAIVSEMPRNLALYEEFKGLMEQVEGKVPRKTWNDLSDMFMAAACEYGNEMFRLGLELGRNPAAIFELPEVDGGGYLVDSDGEA